MVTYDYAVVPSGDSISAIANAQYYEDERTMLESRFDAVKVEGVVVSNEYANLNGTGAADEGKTVIAITNDDDQSTYSGNTTFNVSTDLEDLGRSVVLYVERNSNASNADVFGSVIESGDNLVVVDYTSDTIDELADDNSLDIVTSGSDATQYVTNYGSADDITNSQRTASMTAGTEKYLIDNDDDGEVEYVIVNTYRFGKVTSYVTSGDGSITIRAGSGNTFSKSDADDVVGFEDVSRDDYVVAIEIGGKLYVEPAETVTGTLESLRSSGDTITRMVVDGTEYRVSAVTGYTGGDDGIEAAADYDDANLDNEATFYLTQGGYIAAVGNVEETAYNYALVVATGTTGLEDRVRVVLSDGSTGTYDVNDSGSGLSVSDLDVGTIYSYSINSDGEIRLTAAHELQADTTGVEFSKGRTTISTDAGNYYANSNTVFFYVGVDSIGSSIDTGDVDVYAGYSSAPDLDSDEADNIHAVVYSRNSSSTRAAAVVFYGIDSLSATSVEDIMYITGVNNRTTDYTEVTAFVAGSSEEQTIRVDGRHSGTGVYTFSINSDGYYEVTAAEDESDLDAGVNYFESDSDTQYYVYSANSDTFVLAGDGSRREIVITSDTLLVDDSDYLDNPVGELGAGPDEDDRIAYVVCNNADDMEAVLVVVANTEAEDEEPEEPTEGETATITLADLDYRTGYTFFVNGSEVEATTVPGGMSIAAEVGDTLTIESAGFENGTQYTVNEETYTVTNNSISIEVTGVMSLTLPTLVEE